MLVVDSGIRRGLDDSGYNDRRSQCDDAAAALGVASLRQVSLEMLQSGASSMDRVLVKRARHVITENDRVMRTAEALENGRLDDVARLFESSHGSYADDFEASLPDIDCLVEIARNTEGVFGARLTGGGFGGCTVSLVATETAAAAGAEIVERYRAKTGRSGRWWVSGAADGAHEVVLR
jgi:galactokinase